MTALGACRRIDDAIDKLPASLRPKAREFLQTVWAEFLGIASLQIVPPEPILAQTPFVRSFFTPLDWNGVSPPRLFQTASQESRNNR